MAFKILTMADIHICDKNPMSRKDDYLEAIFGKLEQIKQIALTSNVDVVICSGDIFHLKSPIKNSHYLVGRLIKLFKSFPCPILTIYGSHDLSQDNLLNLPKQPLNTLFEAGACKLLTDETIGNIRFFAVNYQKNPGYRSFNKEKKEEKIQVCVAHLFASSKFDEFFGEKVFKYQELSKLSPDIFIFGHYHPDQGIEIHNKKFFVNVGAISRGSLNSDNLDRIPKVALLKIHTDYTISAQEIKLKVEDSKDIFDLEAKEKEKKEFEESQKFINELKTNINANKKNNIHDTIKSLKFEQDIINKALYYYEETM